MGDDDLNGDGVRFNDRPFIFEPALLPLAGGEEDRKIYAALRGNSLVLQFQAQIGVCYFFSGLPSVGSAGAGSDAPGRQPVSCRVPTSASTA